MSDPPFKMQTTPRGAKYRTECSHHDVLLVKGGADATQNVLLIFLSLALYSTAFARGDHSIPALSGGMALPRRGVPCAGGPGIS